MRISIEYMNLKHHDDDNNDDDDKIMIIIGNLFLISVIIGKVNLRKM